MSPAADANVYVRLDHIKVKNSDIRLGLGDKTGLAVVLDVTNTGQEPYNLRL